MSGSAVLRVRLVGRFAIERGTVAIDERQLGSRKSRLLMKVLAARRGHLVAMDEIIEILWGDDEPARAEANVATLVSRLRGVVGVDAIIGGRNGYRLNVGPLWSVDVDEAAVLVEEAEQRMRSSRPALALTAANAAIELLGGGRVLEDEPSADWAMELSREVERLLRRARAVAWLAHADVGDHRSSLAVAQTAVDADSIDEEAHRAIIMSYHRLGEQGEALRAYERLRTVLVEELGADPGADTEILIGAVLRGEELVADRRETIAANAGDDDFVGRDVELGALLDRWSRASGGTSTCLLISGEAGIGKTRLAAELAAAVRTAGATVLRARCYEAERSLYLQPIVEIIREAVATVPPDMLRKAVSDRAPSLVALVPELASIVGAVDAEVAAGEIERRRTFEAVAQALVGLARIRPLLVVLDDLHEAGASTVEMLHFVLRWDPYAPLMVVATIRADESDYVNEQLAALATTMQLAGLDDSAIRALAGRAGLLDRAEAITAMTRGHTLFVVEAVRALAEAVDPGGPVPSHIAVPASLRDVVTGRARRCGPDVDELVRAAVIVGSAFDVSVLGEMMGLAGEEVVRRAEAARRAGILIEAGGGYEFSNDLIRDVLYETTPRPLRVLRHRSLATLLSQQPEAAAKHAAAAGDIRQAVTQWMAAAERCRARVRQP